jgi:peptide/nickel transport system substrate-binding protein/oligopeptide transport system substrate-binding protein
LGRCKEWSDTGLFLPIEGANAMINGSRQDILGMQAIDEHTLEIKLTKPDGAFIYSLLNPVFWVMDAGATEPLPGTGPFCIKEIKPETISLVRNDNYYRGLPPLSAIEFHIYKDRTQALQTYKKGFIDYLADLPLSELKSMQSDPSYRDLLVSKPLLDVYWLGFNLGREPYNKTYLLRRALNYAIDREAISKQVFGGGYLPAKGVLPQGINGYNKNMTGYQYNPEKAGQLLTEAGYPHGQGLKPLTLTYNSDQGHKQVAEEVSRQLGNLGITVQLQENDWDYYKKQMYQRGMSFFRLEWQADYPDADNFLYSLFHSSKIGASNFTGYSNPQVDKLLDASRLEFRDKEARLKLLKRAEEIIIDDAPCLWLFQKRANGLVSGEVKNLNLNSMGLIDWFKVELVKPEAGAAAAPASKT